MPKLVLKNVQARGERVKQPVPTAQSPGAERPQTRRDEQRMAPATMPRQKPDVNIIPLPGQFDGRTVECLYADPLATYPSGNQTGIRLSGLSRSLIRRVARS